MHAIDIVRLIIRKLKEYLNNRNESITEFSRRSGIAINTIRRIVIDGKAPRINVAKKIVKCTKKEVLLKDLGYE
jgi:predicted transcriptional regulator